MSPYLYSSLKEPGSDLRLLSIDHGPYNEPLVCWLTLQTAGTIRKQYEALSYAWGDGTRKVPIILCGEEFLVTENLRNALRHLRRKTPEEAKKQLPLWINAIFINQEDSNERDAQFRRIKSIYEQAERVIIWLGMCNEPMDEFLRFSITKNKIDRVEENSEAMAHSALVLALVLQEEANQQQSSEVSIGLKDCNYANNLQVWLQLSRLFHRPWFERPWIIQELAVSRKAIVRWGDLQMPWQTLEKAAQFILRPGQAVLPRHIHQMFPILGAHRITQVALQSMYNFDTKNVLTILHKLRKHISPQISCRNLGFSASGSKLSLSGIHTGIILNMTNVGDVVKDLPDPTDLGSRLQQIIVEREMVLYSQTRQSFNDCLTSRGFKKSLLRNFCPWSKHQPDDDVLSRQYDIWCSCCGIGGSTPSLPYFINSSRWDFWDLSRHEVTLKDVERYLFPRVHGCQMFTIEEGRAGIVAGDCGIQVGDELWLLSGGLTAPVLRRVNESEHRLISPCYLFKMISANIINCGWQKVVLV